MKGVNKIFHAEIVAIVALIASFVKHDFNGFYNFRVWQLEMSQKSFAIILVSRDQ